MSNRRHRKKQPVTEPQLVVPDTNKIDQEWLEANFATTVARVRQLPNRSDYQRQLLDDGTARITPSNELRPIQPPMTKELVVYDGDYALDLSILEREITRVFSKWRATGHQDEDTIPSLERAVETFEAARRGAQ